jgi:DNA-binding CsgD family transcriptional regulator
LRFTEGFSAAAKPLGLALEALRRQRPDQAGGRWLWSTGNNVAGIIAIELFDSEARYALSVEQVQAARDAGALVQLGVALHYLAHTNLPGGELALAASQIEESCLITEATGNPPVAYTELALTAFQGREAEATALIRDTVQTAQANGQGRIVSFATYASAVLYNGVGRYDTARDAAIKVIDRNVIGYGSVVVGELAEAASRTGDHDLVQHALSWISERTAAYPNDWSSGLQARIRALGSNGDDADRQYRESISLLANTRLRTQLARGHLLYGEWLRREHRRVDARKQLEIAHELLATMGLEAFAARAARELEATGATARKRNNTTRDQLTAQERRIARLAGEGFTNPEIAAQLFLSTKTIEWHLRKVFTKLAIRSRVQLETALTDAENHPGAA